MPDPSVAIQREIEIDGSRLPDNVLIHLESTTVIDRLTMPDTFTLVFRDPDRNILSTAGIQVGTKVVISTTSTREDAPKVLIDAEVTSIETEYGAHGTLAVVRGYDRSHRLAAGRKSKTFLNAKYSDIATQLASAAGLTPDVDESEGTHDHVFQANQSDLDFLYAPGAPDRLRLPRRRREPAVQEARRVVVRTRPRARRWAPIRPPSCGATTCSTSAPG